MSDQSDSDDGRKAIEDDERLGRLRHILIERGAHPRFVFDESLRSSFSDAQWHLLTTYMFDVLHRYRAVEITDGKTRAELLFALQAWHEITDIVLLLLKGAEDLQRPGIDGTLSDMTRFVCEGKFATLCSVMKAVNGISVERHARLGFLEALIWARYKPIGPLKFHVWGGGFDELSSEEAEQLGPAEVEARGYRVHTPGWWARRLFPSYLHGDGLTLEDWEDAVRVMAQEDASEKWSILVAYISKAGMGTVSPASLAADWRKFRKNPSLWTYDPDDLDPENQDLGDDDPEK